MTRSLAAFLAYCAITVAITHPMAVHLTSALPNDPGDPALNTWILWWNARTIPYSWSWWNAPAFYPVPGVLSFSENLLGLSVVSTPLQWAGATPLLAYNVVFLLTFPACAIGAYLLALEITGRRDAAFVAGLLFGFAPYRMAHLAHIQVLAAFAMPLSLLGLHKYLRDPRARWLPLFAAGWLVQGLTNGYYLLFFSVLVGLWLLWFLPPMTRPRSFGAVLVAWAIAALPLVPLLWHYRTIHERLGFTREIGTIRSFSADVLSLLHAPSSLKFWGWLQAEQRPEGELFPGVTAIVLVAAGAFLLRRVPPGSTKWTVARRAIAGAAAAAAVTAYAIHRLGPWRPRVSGVRLFTVPDPSGPITVAILLAIVMLLTSSQVRRAHAQRSPLAFYAIAALAMWLFALGPAPSFDGKTLMSHGPYEVLMALPGFSALRVPARFWMMAVMSLAMVGAVVFDRLARRGPARWIVASVITIGVMADAWLVAFPVVPPPRLEAASECTDESTGAVLELPLGAPLADIAAMYRSIAHERPTVNGYSGHFPPHYDALRYGLSIEDEDVLTQLAAAGVDRVVVNERPADGGWQEYVAMHPLARLVCAGADRSTFRLTGSGRSSPSSAPLSIARIDATINAMDVQSMTDGDLTTRWHSGPQRAGAAVVIDLGSPRSVQRVDLLLGRSVRDFPRQMLIEVSDDRRDWSHVWRGRSAGRAVIGSADAPREVPLRYDLGGARGRYLRLQLTADDDVYYWSVAEMRVFGR